MYMHPLADTYCKSYRVYVMAVQWTTSYIVHSIYTLTVFPRIIAGGDYFYFHTKRGRLFEGRQLFEEGNYFKYFSQVMP